MATNPPPHHPAQGLGGKRGGVRFASESLDESLGAMLAGGDRKRQTDAEAAEMRAALESLREAHRALQEHYAQTLSEVADKEEEIVNLNIELHEWQSGDDHVEMCVVCCVVCV